MDHKTIRRKLGEKVTTVSVVFQKWKKHKMTIGRLQCGAFASYGEDDHVPKSTQEELVNDIKVVVTTVSKNTVDDTLMA